VEVGDHPAGAPERVVMGGPAPRALFGHDPQAVGDVIQRAGFRGPGGEGGRACDATEASPHDLLVRRPLAAQRVGGIVAQERGRPGGGAVRLDRDGEQLDDLVGHAGPRRGKERVRGRRRRGLPGLDELPGRDRALNCCPTVNDHVRFCSYGLTVFVRIVWSTPRTAQSQPDPTRSLD
jgi:hypothetical protein